MASDRELAEMVSWEEFRQALRIMTPRQRFGVRILVQRALVAKCPDNQHEARELQNLEARALKLRQLDTGCIPCDAEFLGWMVGISELTGPVTREEFEALKAPSVPAPEGAAP